MTWFRQHAYATAPPDALRGQLMVARFASLLRTIARLMRVNDIRAAN
jgi:hypothetical protein